MREPRRHGLQQRRPDLRRTGDGYHPLAGLGHASGDLAVGGTSRRERLGTGRARAHSWEETGQTFKGMALMPLNQTLFMGVGGPASSMSGSFR